MIHTNLSTRPFYNERQVNWVLVVLALVAVAVTVANVAAAVSLSRRDQALGGATARAEREATEARRTADRVRRGIDQAALQTVAAKADEANGLIDRRTFSWTALLTELENALPPAVRLVTLTPRIERDGRLSVHMTLVAQRAEDVNTFAEKLEARRTFADVLLQQERVNPDGLLETIISGYYVGPARRAANTK